MIRSSGILLPMRSDAQSRNSRKVHSGKNPRPRLKRCWRSFAGDVRDRMGSFSPAGLRVNAHRVVCATSGPVALKSRRVSSCDTTRMQAIRRRSTTERIKKPKRVHHVHPRRHRVDAKNRQTAAAFLNHVQASTPKCNVRSYLTKDNPKPSTVKIKEICRLGWTLGRRFSAAPQSCEYLRPPKSAMGGRGGHLSGEVIL